MNGSIVMENSNPVILEISSDDESSFGEAIRGGGGCGSGEDRDWLSELLDEVDRGTESTDDSDDVILVNEVVVKPKKARLNSSNSSAKIVNYNGGDDDECVILDGDPDKPLAVENSKVDDDDSDDLLVVGEKGQVACRDFPHARHLCVTFPFASTPHDTHCDRCHCYVCDSPAPCARWGSGISSIDHCHATDKVECWKTQRKSMKESDKTQPILNVASLANLVPPLHPVQANSSVTVRSRTHFGIPNIMNQARSQTSRPAVPRYRYQPRMVPQQLHSTQDRNIFSKNSRHVGSRGRQFIPLNPCTSFKESGQAQVDSVNDRRGYGLSKNSYGSQFSNNLPLPRFYASHGEVHQGVSDFANYAPPELQMSSQACRRNFLKACSSQPQIASQPNVRNHFQNTTIPQRPLVSQPNGGITFHPLPSQTHASTLLCTGSTSEHPVSPMFSQPNMDSTYESFVFPQPQVYTAPTSLPNDGQNIFQQENQMQSGLGTSCTDFGISWDPSVSRSNQQIPAGISQLQNQVSADNFPYQGVAKEDNNEFQSVPPEDNSYVHVAKPADNFSFIDDNNSGFPGSTDPDSLDCQLDWMFENQSVPGALEVSVPPALNVYSPEPGTIDAGWSQSDLSRCSLGTCREDEDEEEEEEENEWDVESIEKNSEFSSENQFKVHNMHIKEEMRSVNEFDTLRFEGEENVSCNRAWDADISSCINQVPGVSKTKGDIQGAEEYHSRAILADPGDGEILSKYAKLVWELYRDEDLATNYFERAVQASSHGSHIQAAYASFLWEIEDEDQDEASKDSFVGLLAAAAAQPLPSHGFSKCLT